MSSPCPATIERCVKAPERLPNGNSVAARSLHEHGYALLPEVLDTSALALCREVAGRLSVSLGSGAERALHAAIGSLLDVSRDPEVVELITWPRAFAALGALGHSDPRFLHGILFEKAAHTPPTFWHQDGMSWSHPSSYDAVPQELILIYYLVNTHAHNGCLRVIPGSHRRRHPLHDWLAQSRTEELRRMASGSDPAFRSYAEEVSLPVAAGDLIVLDARVLHAAHANDSDQRRPALSLWYATDVGALPEPIRARFSLVPREGCRLPYVPEHWAEGARRRLRAVLPPRYAGTAEPLPLDNNPGPRLS